MYRILFLFCVLWTNTSERKHLPGVNWIGKVRRRLQYWKNSLQATRGTSDSSASEHGRVPAHKGRNVRGDYGRISSMSSLCLC